MREPKAAAVTTSSSGADGHVSAAVAADPGTRNKVATTPTAPPRATSSPARGIAIERLILHQLDSARGRLELVDEEVALDERTHAFFAAQIASAAERADWRAAFLDPDDEVPLLCRKLLVGAEEFIAASRVLVPGDLVLVPARIGKPDPTHLNLTLIPSLLDAAIYILSVELPGDTATKPLCTSSACVAAQSRGI